MMKAAAKYWGYLLVVVIVGGWFSWGFGPPLLIGLSSIAFVYFLFQAPTWCGASNRGTGFCRNNASGLLRSCHLRQHRAQRLAMFAPGRWKSFGRFILRDPRVFLSCAASVGTVISALAAVAALFLG